MGDFGRISTFFGKEGCTSLYRKNSKLAESVCKIYANVKLPECWSPGRRFGYDADCQSGLSRAPRVNVLQGLQHHNGLSPARRIWEFAGAVEFREVKRVFPESYKIENPTPQSLYKDERTFQILTFTMFTSRTWSLALTNFIRFLVKFFGQTEEIFKLLQRLKRHNGLSLGRLSDSGIRWGRKTRLYL